MYAVSAEAKGRLSQILALEAADPRWLSEVSSHELRVAELCRAVADLIGLSSEATAAGWLGGRFHDIGKLCIDANLLFKEGPLNYEQRETMDRHTSMGADLLEGGDVPIPTFLLDAVLFHHERFDGQGRFGLTGRAIPLIARIVAVADAFDAMTSDRSYKKAFPERHALGVLVRDGAGGRGRQFDPAIVRHFVLMRLNEPTCDFNKIARTVLETACGTPEWFEKPSFRSSVPNYYYTTTPAGIIVEIGHPPRYR